MDLLLRFMIISELSPEVELHDGASGRILLSEVLPSRFASTKYNQAKCNSFAQ